MSFCFSWEMYGNVVFAEYEEYDSYGFSFKGERRFPTLGLFKDVVLIVLGSTS